MSQRKRYTADYKARVAVEALKGQRTSNQLASDYGVHPTLIGQWKKQATDGLQAVFAGNKGRSDAEKDALIEGLYQQVGQLKYELDWVKKKSGRVC